LPKKGKYVSPVEEKAIAKRLRDIRTRRGKTQVEMAKVLGISQSLYSEYERGDVRLHGGLIAGLARTLRTSADELLLLKAPKENGTTRDRRFLKRLDKIDKLSKTDKQVLLTTIDAFLSKLG
jgi:transcriptional regulator with XRE-family HTH domain